MKKIAFFEREFSLQKISITVFYKKDGLILDICGPNDHLGGVGIGIPYIRKNGDESASFHCISIPSHRDSELAGSIARIISKITRFPAVTILGVHFPGISQSQISELTSFFETWVFDIGKRLVMELSSDSDKQGR
ncbi:MAG: prenylated flavin chaperone LpdD [Candidatus Hodarchaeales archaeon]